MSPSHLSARRGAKNKYPFDPIAILKALEERGVVYIFVGALGRVIHGTDEITEGVDIVPALAARNLRQLRFALEDLNAHRAGGNLSDLAKDIREQPLLELQTDAGEVKIIREPAGTRGYQTLRSRANRELLGHGVRPSVASREDHAIMIAVLNRERDLEPLATLRRLMDLDYQRRRAPAGRTQPRR